MILKKILLIIVIIVLCIFNLKGCTCASTYYSNFFDAITKHPVFTQNEINIVKVKILSISDDYYFMNIEILEEIQGTLNDTVKVIAGQDGLNCAVPFNNGFFHVNDTLIMALVPDFEGRSDTLELNDCSLSYLKYSNNRVFGNISSSETNLEYFEFKQKIGNVLSSVFTISNPNQIFNIFPNPTDGRFHLELENLNNNPYQVQITNEIGQIFFDRKVNGNFYKVGEELPSLKKGFYFVTVINEKRMNTKKLIVN